MASKRKSLARKLRLLKKDKSNRRVPSWVVERTNRHVMRHPQERSWRRGHLHL
ncbi:MAG: 50S ribosomal protein L39e [Candidatus Thermoplasmatota archaeon]|jgi:large subunit ribosomal protein L39e|nr:50S ribosomal protein L39e [Candidatus Thermoplasmatota archaeon]MCL5984362.1 50S ribosomal protein L39e [Candidatus Thermoplasmatota archaeon]